LTYTVIHITIAVMIKEVMKVSLGEQINRIRKQKKISIDELCALSGIPKGTLSKITAGITTNPTLDTVKSIAAALGCSLEDLSDSPKTKKTHTLYSQKEDHMIKKYRLLDVYDKQLVDDVLEAAYNHTTRNISPEDAEAKTYIKCYELPAAAGTGEPLGDTYYTDTIQVETQRLPRNAHMCIRVHGNSMEPAYRDGDIVFVQRLDGESVRVGEIGIFALNGDGYIKRLGQGALESLNPQYSPIPIHDYDDLRCQGRVLGKI